MPRHRPLGAPDTPPAAVLPGPRLTLCAYAFYRHLGSLMTPEELTWARELAKRSEAGDRAARNSLDRLMVDVWADAENRQRGDT